MAHYSRYSSEELTNLIATKILRYAELLRKTGRKSIDADEQEEYLQLRSELLELNNAIQRKKEKISQGQ